MDAAREPIEVRQCCNTTEDENHRSDCSRMKALDSSFRQDPERRRTAPNSQSLHRRVLAVGNGHGSSWITEGYKGPT